MAVYTEKSHPVVEGRLKRFIAFGCMPALALAAFTAPATAATAQIAAASTEDPTVVSGSAAVTEGETPDMKQRFETQMQLGPLTKALESDPTFAGLYIDAADASIVVVETTGNPDAVWTRYQAMTPVGAQLRVDHVTYSLKQLNDVQASVSGDYDALIGRGIDLSSVGVDLALNRVRVDIVGLTKQTSNYLLSTYGDMLVVENGDQVQATACVSRDNCGSPLKGGIHITGNGWSCTATGLAKVNNLPGVKLITAGHCIKDAGLSATWFHNGVAIGSGYVYDFHDGANADVGAIDAFESGNRNKAYATSNSDVRSMTATASDAQQPVGGSVCRSGITSGYDCGSITRVDIDVIVGGTLIHHMWETNYPSAGGDSGAPMMFNFTWMGDESATTAGNSYYSTTHWINSMILAAMCINAACL